MYYADRLDDFNVDLEPQRKRVKEYEYVKKYIPFNIKQLSKLS